MEQYQKVSLIWPHPQKKGQITNHKGVTFGWCLRKNGKFSVCHEGILMLQSSWVKQVEGETGRRVSVALGRFSFSYIGVSVLRTFTFNPNRCHHPLITQFSYNGTIYAISSSVRHETTLKSLTLTRSKCPNGLGFTRWFRMLAFSHN